jgi:phospholipase C
VKGRAAALAALIVVLAACSAPVAVAPAVASPSPLTTPAPTTDRAATAAPPATPAATARPALPHVFIVVMENTGLARAMRSKTIAALAGRSLTANSYHAVARPSLPNYLAMTSGSTWDITDNSYYSLPNTGIGAQLTAAGISWRAYMEGLTAAGCMRSPYPYALKHNPFAYFGGACPENVVPFEVVDADLAGTTPQFVWVTPGLCHDGHDCPIDEAAAWLDTLVGKITSSRAFAERGILLIAWDEGDGGDANLVPFLALTSGGRGGEITGAHDHYSLLATIEDLFGLPRLGAAKDAKPMAELLGAG